MVAAASSPVIDWLPALSVGDVGVILGALVAARTLSVGLLEGWRRTLGRRGDLYRRLARLGVGAQLAFFEAVIGEPPAMKRTVSGPTIEVANPPESESASRERPRLRKSRRLRRLLRRRSNPEPPEELFIWKTKEYTETIFVDRYFFLQAISDDEGTVQAFSVTTRHRRFKPIFTGLPRPARRWERAWRWIQGRGYSGYLFKIKLGRTKFVKAGEGASYVRAWAGVRASAYSEGYGGGTPTLHQAFVLTASTAGVVPPPAGVLEVASALGHGQWSPGETRPDDRYVLPEPPPEEFEDIPEIDQVRREGVITTYSVLLMPPDMYPDTTFGPHGDEVALLP